MTTVFKSTLGSYFYDHNENGQVDDNEHWYPRIDLNGSGDIDLADFSTFSVLFGTTSSLSPPNCL